MVVWFLKASYPSSRSANLNYVIKRTAGRGYRVSRCPTGPRPLNATLEAKVTEFVLLKSVERSYRKVELLKLMSARSDFGGARHAARMLLEHAPELGSDLNYPLLVAAVVCYSRPFTDNKPHGGLANRYERSLPEKLRAVHEEALRSRNEFFAHSDLRVRQAYICPAGSLLGSEPLELRSAGLGSAINFRMYPPSFLAGLHDASSHLLGLLSADIQALLDELFGGMELPAAKFKLRIDNGL
jgi:hypothetical protein